VEVLWPGPLFGLSAGCFGKQDCQICGERERERKSERERGGAFASIV